MLFLFSYLFNCHRVCAAGGFVLRLGAAYSAFAHMLVTANVGVGELAVLLYYYGYCQ